MDVRMKLHWCMLTSPPSVGSTHWQLAAARWTSATLFAEEQNSGCCLMDRTHSISHVVVHDVLLARALWCMLCHSLVEQCFFSHHTSIVDSLLMIRWTFLSGYNPKKTRL